MRLHGLGVVLQSERSPSDSWPEQCLGCGFVPGRGAHKGNPYVDGHFSPSLSAFLLLSLKQTNKQTKSLKEIKYQPKMTPVARACAGRTVLGRMQDGSVGSPAAEAKGQTPRRVAGQGLPGAGSWELGAGALPQCGEVFTPPLRGHGEESVGRSAGRSMLLIPRDGRLALAFFRHTLKATRFPGVTFHTSMTSAFVAT